MLCQHTTVQIIGGNKCNKQTSWELLLLFTNFKNEHGRSGPNFSSSGHEKNKIFILHSEFKHSKIFDSTNCILCPFHF